MKAVAKSLGATLLRPYYPASDLFRLMRDQDLLQVDFMGRADGIRSPEGLRRRATRVDLGGYELLVASLSDIIQSKRAAGRPQDRAVLEILEKALHEATKASTDKA